MDITMSFMLQCILVKWCMRGPICPAKTAMSNFKRFQFEPELVETDGNHKR